MNQDHVLLLFKFPEHPDEYVMAYTSDELALAKQDAAAFIDMYDEVLYVAVLFAYEDGREEELFRWNNPQTDRLLKLASSVGGVGMPLGYPTISDFALDAGTSSPKSNSKSTRWRPGARPPSEGAYEAPLPTASKTYSGNGARTRRGLPRRKR